jgi:hypothetical protein
MKIDRYAHAVTITMHDELRARVQEELFEHWSDAQETGSRHDPEALFGDPILLSQQLTTAMKPSTRVTDVLWSVLLACVLFIFTVTTHETFISLIDSSVAAHWGRFFFFLGSAVGIIMTYAALLVPVGFFFHHLNITAPHTLFAEQAKRWSYSLGTGLGILALLPKFLGFSSYAQNYAVAQVFSLLLLTFLSILGYSWAHWFSGLPEEKIQRFSQVFQRFSPLLVFTASALALLLISDPGANFVNSPISSFLSPVLTLLSPIALLLMFTRFFFVDLPGAWGYSALTWMQIWAVIFIFLPLFTFTVISFVRGRVSYATRLGFAFFLPLFIFSPLLRINHPSPQWYTTVSWSSAEYEHERTGFFAPWALTTIGPSDNHSLLYAVYRGDGDVRIFADATVFFAARGEDIVSLRQESVMPVTSSLSSGIVEQDFSCSRTPVQDAGNWIFPCGTLSYKGKPLADLEDLTLREAIVVPGSNRAVVHVSRGMGSELVTIVELP